MTKIIAIIVAIVVGALVFVYWLTPEKIPVKPNTGNFPTISNPTKPKTNEQIEIKSVLWDVPFVVQAPFGDWKDPRQQDGCEEASSLMAVRFARNQTQPISKSEALKIILDISDWQKERYGSFEDESIFDTNERILKGYFNYTQGVVKDVTSVQDIILELVKGNVLILAMNGQLLNNPYFTQPGPERHMLVVRGYSMETDEFITNDPGVYQGEKYSYPTKVFFNAIRDYPTGFHVPILDLKKIMIVVPKISP